MNAAIYSRPSAVSLKVWLHETMKRVTELVCVQAPSVSLQSDIATYWSGMYNTVFLDIFMDLCEQGLF